MVLRTSYTQRVGYVFLIRTRFACCTYGAAVSRYCEEAGIALTELLRAGARRQRLRVCVTLRTRSVFKHVFEMLAAAHLTRVCFVLKPRIAKTVQRARRVRVVERSRALRTRCACFRVLSSEETGLACNAVQGCEVLGL